jgi:hypothetical protein
LAFKFDLCRYAAAEEDEDANENAAVVGPLYNNLNNSVDP